LNRTACLLLALAAGPAVAATGADLFVPADLDRLADLAEPTFSPDGGALAYVVSAANLEKDKSQSDLWRVDYAGGRRLRLTDTPDSSEWRPQWSGDGKSLAFLSDRKASPRQSDDDATAQVWAMPSTGGRAKRLTGFADGVDDFALSPDGRTLAVVALDPRFPPGAKKPENPPPIVTSRFQFKDDDRGWLDARRKHLYLVDVASGKTVQLTSGAHDEILPAWSPDGSRIAFVSKRGGDPDRSFDFDLYVIDAKAGARERQLTDFPGADLDPEWESYPAWSPDGSRIAYLRADEDKWLYYAMWQLAVVDVATGKSSVPAPVDRCFYHPHWSADGRSVIALVERSLVTHAARIDANDGTVSDLDRGDRFDYDLAVSANGRIAVLGGNDDHPYALSAVEDGGLRTLADHNEWLGGKKLAKTEAIHFESGDGTPIDGLLVRPVGYEEGRRYPTILRVHGGPVYQFSREFMPDWQAYAAAGYAVLAVNPRGSSGRGFDFARAIWADWGHLDTQDLLAGVDYAVARGIADPDRLGIGGWSYGGILTDQVVARDPRFKAAVSGAGAGDMYAMYGHDEYAREYELELGVPWKDADRAAYDRTSYPFLHADRIGTPTLFECAGDDFNVPCLGGEQMYQALRSLGVPTQLVVYPGEHHELTVPSYLRDRLQRNIAWYDRFLKD
jgi:dipeptidyl aminopeptidase/acylaminoacyl peptidase